MATRVKPARSPSMMPGWGELNSLSPEQSAALVTFKDKAEAAGVYTRATDSIPASHDDDTLIRFLRARKFNPSDALQQFEATCKWRRETNLDALYETIDVDEYETWRNLYPQWTGRRSRDGFPVYVWEVAKINTKIVSSLHARPAKTAGGSALMPLFALYENLVRFVLPLCSMMRPNLPQLTRSVNLIDISGVSMMQLWQLKSHMQEASTLATAHYPETLEAIYVIGAPPGFGTVWTWLKRWFDQHTVGKIHIFGSGDAITAALKEIMDADDIPEKYGGTPPFRFGMLPILSPSIQAALSWRQPHEQAGANTVHTGPAVWVDNSTLVAKGSTNDQPREFEVATFALPEQQPQYSNGQHLPLPTAAAAANSGVTSSAISSPPPLSKVDAANDSEKDLGSPPVLIMPDGLEKTVVETSGSGLASPPHSFV